MREQHQEQKEPPANSGLLGCFLETAGLFDKWVQCGIRWYLDLGLPIMVAQLKLGFATAMGSKSALVRALGSKREEHLHLFRCP